ncbi:hypothetical protein F4803DRAFT_508280 [Xylaria telfairii]|nr:hypothetical protein F4803DRAFT_508280 [Xylaria telfairii]
MYSSEGLDDSASSEGLSSSVFDCDLDIPGFGSFSLANDFPDVCLEGIPLSPECPSPEHSPPHTEESADTQPGLQESAPKPKRKRENRYKNAPPSVLSRRRAQNRASQRAYRERKDQRIKDLEVIINNLERKNEMLTKAYESVKFECWKLRTQYDTGCQQPSITWDPPSSQLGDGLLYYGDPTMSIANAGYVME